MNKEIWVQFSEDADSDYQELQKKVLEESKNNFLCFRVYGS